MNIKSKHIIAVIFVLMGALGVASFDAHAQAKVTGWVVYNDVGMGGMRVELRQPFVGGAMVTSTQSAPNGFFEIATNIPDEYWVQVVPTDVNNYFMPDYKSVDTTYISSGEVEDVGNIYLYRKVHLVSPAMNSTAGSSPTLQWEPVPGATLYRIELFQPGWGGSSHDVENSTRLDISQVGGPLRAGNWEWSVKAYKGMGLPLLGETEENAPFLFAVGQGGGNGGGEIGGQYEVCIGAQDMLGHRIAIDVGTSLAGLTGENFNTIRTTTQGDEWCANSDGSRVFIRGPLGVTIDHAHSAQNAQYPANHRETYGDYIYTGPTSGASSGASETEARSSFVPEGNVRVTIKYVETESGIIPPDTEPTPSPSPGQGNSVQDFDADNDCMIGDPEFFEAIDQWISQSVDNALFFQLVDAWIGQESICAVASSIDQEDVAVTLSLGSEAIFRVQRNDHDVIRIEVIDLAGNALSRIQSSGSILRWNLMNLQGRPVANGVYFYRLFLTSRDGKLMQDTFGKLAIVR